MKLRLNPVKIRIEPKPLGVCSLSPVSFSRLSHSILRWTGVTDAWYWKWERRYWSLFSLLGLNGRRRWMQCAAKQYYFAIIHLIGLNVTLLDPLYFIRLWDGTNFTALCLEPLRSTLSEITQSINYCNLLIDYWDRRSCPYDFIDYLLFPVSILSKELRFISDFEQRRIYSLHTVIGWRRDNQNIWGCAQGFGNSAPYHKKNVGGGEGQGGCSGKKLCLPVLKTTINQPILV